jgi:trigger factor
MQVKSEKMPTPVRYIVTLDESEMKERKTRAYEQKKAKIEVAGFRKGNVPQNIAEDRIGVEKLYKSIIDETYHEVASTEPIVSSRDFKFYGDLKKDIPFTIEFIAEVKPTVVLTVFEKIKDQVKIEAVEVTEEDFKNKIDFELKQDETIENTTKDVLDNLDVAIIDFEGRVEGDSKPFKGGIAKGFQICINEIVNGHKQFVGDFEDQLVGMKIEETKDVKVKFPSNYRDTSLAGKDSVFTVTLRAIKAKIVPQYSEEFAKKKGFETIETYEEFLKKSVLQTKQKKAIEEFKKLIVTEIIKQSEVSPIPDEMIMRENEKEWNAFLRRVNKTEEQFVKENKNSKVYFFENNTSKSIEIIKATLVIEQISKNYNIDVEEEEVLQYVMRVSDFLRYEDNRKERLGRELKENKRQFELMKVATRNEKTIDFLYEQFKS